MALPRFNLPPIAAIWVCLYFSHYVRGFNVGVVIFFFAVKYKMYRYGPATAMSPDSGGAGDSDSVLDPGSALGVKFVPVGGPGPWFASKRQITPMIQVGQLPGPGPAHPPGSASDPSLDPPGGPGPGLPLAR
jgi:hypothetical protein